MATLIYLCHCDCPTGRALAALLRAEGLDVASDHDAASRDESMRSMERADLLIADMAEDEKLLAEMRRRRPDLPFVLISGRCEDRMKHRLEHLQPLWQLPKPFEARELLSALGQALGGQREQVEEDWSFLQDRWSVTRQRDQGHQRCGKRGKHA